MPTDPDAAADPAVYDHLRPTDADVPAGVYRVVGTGGPVTLLRVADADGRRTNTGAVVAVDRDGLAGFEPADNPDGNRPPGAVVRSALAGVYWSLRAFWSSLAAHPLATGAAVGLVLAGSRGRGTLPDPVPTLLVVAGVLGLAYVGGGRL